MRDDPAALIRRYRGVRAYADFVDSACGVVELRYQSAAASLSEVTMLASLYLSGAP